MKRAPVLEGRDADILKGIFKISSEAIILVDVESRILMFSSGAESIFGYEAAEVLGRPLELLIPERFRGRHAGQIARFCDAAIDSISMRQRGEVLGLRKNGEEFPIEASLSKLDTPSGIVFTAVMRDVTDWRSTQQLLSEAAEAADAANAAKSIFVATMSHEIRTPLNGVLGMAQAMSQDELSPVQRERLDVIRESGESLLAILNDVLDLSKIEAGKLEVEEIEFDLEDLLHGAQAAFTSLANKKGLSFAMDCRDAEGVYRGDPVRIRQIVYNLISNAVKFTDSGEVRLAARLGAEGLRLSVADTGVGIDEAVRERLFSAFVQADVSTTRRFGGTGLGLAISRHLAQLMGGALSVDSRLGVGSTFTLILPVRPIAPPRPRQVPAGPTMAASRPIRILAAEDNPTNQLVLKTLLHQAGVTPVIVANGELAVEAWRNDQFDAILMDVQMPELDGPGATRRIRSLERELGRRRTPVIGLTANAMGHQLELYRASGMDAVVTKPIDVAKLFAALDCALDAEPPATTERAETSRAARTR